MNDKPTLTRMQTTCLQMAADGLTQERSAYLLGIKRTTIKYHLAKARGRLGAQSTAEAVGIAVAYGIIEIREEKDEESKAALGAIFTRYAEDRYRLVGADRHIERPSDWSVTDEA